MKCMNILFSLLHFTINNMDVVLKFVYSLSILSKTYSISLSTFGKSLSFSTANNMTSSQNKHTWLHKVNVSELNLVTQHIEGYIIHT